MPTKNSLSAKNNFVTVIQNNPKQLVLKSGLETTLLSRQFYRSKWPGYKSNEAATSDRLMVLQHLHSMNFEVFSNIHDSMIWKNPVTDR